MIALVLSSNTLNLGVTCSLMCRKLSPIAQSVALPTLARSPARPIFFPGINDRHCDRIDSSLTTLHCFDSGYVGKQPVAWKEYCAEYWLTLSQTSPGFYGSAVHIFWKQRQKRRNRSKWAISPFSTVFSTCLRSFLPFSTELKLSSANCFNLDESKICR